MKGFRWLSLFSLKVSLFMVLSKFCLTQEEAAVRVKVFAPVFLHPLFRVGGLTEQVE
jgi:hypothetical protein